jgi:hypothetical protein
MVITDLKLLQKRVGLSGLRVAHDLAVLLDVRLSLDN